MSTPRPRLVTVHTETDRLQRQHKNTLAKVSAELAARDQTIAALTAQLHTIERTILRVIDSPMSAAQRQEFVRLLIGTRRLVADDAHPVVTTPGEERLIHAYRRMDTADKQLLARFLQRLTAPRRGAKKGGAR